MQVHHRGARCAGRRLAQHQQVGLLAAEAVTLELEGGDDAARIEGNRVTRLRKRVEKGLIVIAVAVPVDVVHPRKAPPPQRGQNVDQHGGHGLPADRKRAGKRPGRGVDTPEKGRADQRGNALLVQQPFDFAAQQVTGLDVDRHMQMGPVLLDHPRGQQHQRPLPGRLLDLRPGHLHHGLLKNRIAHLISPLPDVRGATIPFGAPTATLPEFTP